jgi:hypothetical protein
MSARSHRHLGGAFPLLIAVGCATAVVDNDPGFVAPNEPVGAAATGATGTGGATSVAGTASRAMGGGAGTLTGVAGRGGTFGGAGTAAGRAGVSAACPAPRMPAQPGAAQGNSGSFDTIEAVCFFVEGTFNTWNCSNLGGRTVTVNGTPTMCGGALPAQVDGGYYFEFGASSDGTNYTSFYWYTS